MKSLVIARRLSMPARARRDRGRQTRRLLRRYAVLRISRPVRLLFHPRRSSQRSPWGAGMGSAAFGRHHIQS